MGHVYRRYAMAVVPSKAPTEEDARSVEAPRSSGAEVADFLARVNTVACKCIGSGSSSQSC